MDDPSKSETVSAAELFPIAIGVKADLAELHEKNNGVLPSVGKLICALLDPHTRDAIILKVSAIRGGKALLAKAWEKIQSETEAVQVALISNWNTSALIQVEATPVANDPHESDESDDDFGGCQVAKKLSTSAAAIAANDANSRAHLLAQQEIAYYKKMAGVVKPLLPQKKDDYFNTIEWWMEIQRSKVTVALRVVAISHLIVHASAARTERTFSWAGIIATARRFRLSDTMLSYMVFCKRNEKFLPSNAEVVDAYKALYPDRRLAKSENKTTSENTVQVT